MGCTAAGRYSHCQIGAAHEIPAVAQVAAPATEEAPAQLSGSPCAAVEALAPRADAPSVEVAGPAMDTPRVAVAAPVQSPGMLSLPYAGTAPHASPEHIPDESCSCSCTVVGAWTSSTEWSFSVPTEPGAADGRRDARPRGARSALSAGADASARQIAVLTQEVAALRAQVAELQTTQR